MKRFLLLTALSLTSCESIPVTVSYTGESAGHSYLVGYTTGKGVVLAAKKTTAEK